MVGAGRPEENTSQGCAASARFLLGLVAVGILWRALIAALTPLPSEDGANYLWMAERFAAGDAGAALSEVFPPLLPLLTAIPVSWGIDPFRAGQAVLILVGALSLVFLVRGAEALVPGAGRCAGCLAVFAPLPVRFAAEIYTEPLFHLFSAIAVWQGLRARWWGLGLAAGVAFWVRPEAALLVAGFVVVRPRQAWRALLPFAAGMVVLMLWRASHGLGYDLIAKVPFVWDRSVLASDGVGAGIAAVGSHLARIPWLWIEAFGVLGLLALWGILRARTAEQRPLYVALALGVLLICFFLPRRRFLVSWLAVVSPIALVGFTSLPLRARTFAFWLAIASSLLLSLRTMDADRAAERELGAYLATQLEPGDEIIGDMTRVVYFAGRRPLAPRLFSAEELIADAARPEVRYVVLVSHREKAGVVEEGLAGAFERAALARGLDAAILDRGITVLERVASHGEQVR